MLGGLGRFSVISQQAGENPSVVKRNAPEFKQKALAMFGGLGGASSSQGSATTSASISTSGNVMRSVVDDFINVADVAAARRIYHDIYYHDAVGGTATDLLSTLPWSDFTIVGLPNSEQLKAYSTTISNMNFKSLFPQISIDYLVTGTFVGILNFSSAEKVFTSISPQDIANCEINELPIYGMDPLIDIKISGTLLKLMQQASKDPRLKGLMDQIPDFVVKNAAKGKIELNPSNALYIPRRTFSTTSLGTSYFRRLLPLYILEKALLRGTIDSAYKRQRGILHIVCLTGDTMISVDGRLQRLDSIHSRKGMKAGESKPVDFITKGKDGKLVRATKWVYQGKKSVRSITTKSGYSIKSTADHQFLVLDSNADLVWREAQALLADDYLCLDSDMANTMNKAVKSNALNIIPHERNKRGPKAIEATTPSHMTPDLGYMLGNILSDGTIRDYTYGICLTDKSIVKRYSECNKSVFDLDVKIRRIKGGLKEVRGQLCKVKKQYSATSNSVQVIDMLTKIGVHSNRKLNPTRKISKISSKKLLPWSISQADIESKLAFLAGYIDGDGTVLCNQDTGAIEICIASTSKGMLHQLQTMLLDMGVRSTIGGINLYVGRTDGTRIYGELSKYLCVKSKKFDHELPVIRDRQFGLPLSILQGLIFDRYAGRAPERRQYLFKNDDGAIVHVPYWGQLADAVIYGKNRVSLGYSAWNEGEFSKFLEALRIISADMADKIEALLAKGYLFEQVSSVRKLLRPQHVYDLSIDKKEEPAFVANGIVVHNCGDSDWEPNAQELTSVAQMFVQAGLDPTGAIIATRDGVQTNELSSGENFWKHEDSEPSLTAQKMRALGINDSLFNSDATYSTLEASLSVFIEQLRTYREMVTRKTLYDKIFPAIAVANNFKKTKKEQLQTLGAYGSQSIGAYSSSGYEILCDGQSMAPNLKNLGVDLTDYHMPKVHWHKSLKPEADDAYLAILATLEEKGVPIALRQWAAAGGISITELMASLGEDLDIRKKIKKEFTDKMPKTSAQEVREMTAAYSGTGLKPQGINSRKFAPEIIRDKDTGKILSAKGRKVLSEKMHKNTAQALSRIAMRENHKIKLNKTRSKYYTPSANIFGTM